MENRAFNFSAGPCMLPDEVIARAKAEFGNYQNTGTSIFEMSHRGPEFSEVLARAEKNVRDLMDLTDQQHVLFIHGGASLQFLMTAMNLRTPNGTADFALTGTWSKKAMAEAARFGQVNAVCNSEAAHFKNIPHFVDWQMTPQADYLHITSNNTIFGTQYHEFPTPPDGVPIIADMSSDIMSRVINMDQFGLIYAGLQKNLGPSGLGLVIAQKELLEQRQKSDLPTLLDYQTYVKHHSMFNTPPTFQIYMLALVTDWLMEKGGISVIEQINDAKSETLYEVIDNSGYYRGTADGPDRSRMNITFRLPSEALEARFVEEAAKAGLTGLKGHRSVGGIRASIYNSMPLKGVSKLVDFMQDFQERHPS